MDCSNADDIRFDFDDRAQAVWVGNWYLGTWTPTNIACYHPEPGRAFSCAFKLFCRDDPVLRWMDQKPAQETDAELCKYISRRLLLFFQRSKHFIRSRRDNLASCDLDDHWWAYRKPNFMMGKPPEEQ